MAAPIRPMPPSPAVAAARAAVATAHAHRLPQEVIEERQRVLADVLHADRIDRAVRAVADAAPELTTEQRDTLSCLLANH